MNQEPTQWQPLYQPPPPQKKKRGACGCVSVLLALLLVGGITLMTFAVLGRLDLLEWPRSTFAPQSTSQPLPTLPPPKPGEAPRLPTQGRVRSHYRALTQEERQAYDAILAQLPGFPERIEIPHLGGDGISHVFFALLRDNPMIFQLSSESITRTGGGKSWFHPSYRMDADEYWRRCAELADICAVIAAGIPKGATEFEKELAVHDAILRRCEYSYTGDAEENTAYGALVLGKAACEGYARAMVLLLDQQEIDSCIVTGDATNSSGETSKHAWNKVRVGGNWYHVDVTWDDPVAKEGDARLRGFSHGYFNLNDLEMGLSHEIAPDSKPCTATEANYFVAKGLWFRQIDRDAETALAQALAEAVNTGEYMLEFRCADAAGYQAAIKRLFSNQRVYRVLSNANLASEKKISSRRVSYMEIKALHIVQILPEVSE